MKLEKLIINNFIKFVLSYSFIVLAVFDDFLRSYLNHYQRKSLDTDQFKAYLLNYFKDNEKLASVDWDTWLYKDGMPPIIPE